MNDSPKTKVTFLKKHSKIIDEIWDEKRGIHVERMSSRCYWMGVGDATFLFETQGPGSIRLVEQ